MDDAQRPAWQPARARRRKRLAPRQLLLAAGLFAVATAGGALWLRAVPRGPLPQLAAVDSVAGDVVLREDSGAAAPAPLLRTESVPQGAVIQAAPGSRLTLRRPGGILIHVGGGTELQWQTRDALRITHGVVYVDTNEGEHAVDALEILTHTGRIRHVGTRFSVQVDDLDVRVLVRDGAVAIGTSRAEQRIGSGQSAHIDAGGSVSTARLTPGEGPWQWLGAEQPAFAIDGRRLDDVLADLALASGLPLRYASPEIEASARELVLHGPTLALQADEAIDAVLLTTRFARRAPLEIVARP